MVALVRLEASNFHSWAFGELLRRPHPLQCFHGALVGRDRDPFGADARVHGPYKNNAVTVVDPLVTYYLGRGETLADIPLDVPSVNKSDHERRWRARLTAAKVTDDRFSVMDGVAIRASWFGRRGRRFRACQGGVGGARGSR